MGCDIHLFIENKDSNGKWNSTELDDNYLSNRNYFLFSLLANVRNNHSVFIKTIHQNSGLPSDCCNIIKENIEDSDYHSFNWISTKELFEIDYQSPFLNWIDYSGYNKDYDSYPYCLQKLFTRRKAMSKEEALISLSYLCSKPILDQSTELTLYNFVGSKFLNAVKELYELYPEGRLIFYFDN